MVGIDQFYSKVNLTPLLDVIFLLLFLFVGGVASREQETIQRYQADKDVERQLNVLIDVQRQRNEELQARLRARTEGKHRTLAAKQVLDHNFAVYELWLDPDHWARLRTPKKQEIRARVTSDSIRQMLETGISKMADNQRTVVLFFQSPRSIWGDVLIARAELKRGGWIMQEYTLPSKKKR